MAHDTDWFWGNVDVGDPDACWEWQKCRYASGYGKLGVKKRTKRAHRIAYELTHGSLDPDICVLHKCDNRPCCNPAHLFLGDRADNAADRQQKGRSTGGRNFGTRWNAKLTLAQVDEIAERYAAGGISQRELGESYGLTQSGIGYALRRRKALLETAP